MKKTIKTFLAMLLICLSSVAIFGCGTKVTKLEYVEGSMDTTLVVGEELVTTGFKAVATMSDDTQVNLTEKDVEFNTDDLDLTTPGNKELEYSYKDKTDTIDIVVTPSAENISSLTYTGTMKTEMGLGDDLDYTGFSAKAKYADGTEVTLGNDDVTFNLSAVDFTTTGEKYLPFSFQGKTNYVIFSIIESTQISAFKSDVVTDFANNTKADTETEKNPFMVKGDNADSYYVGDYNDFDFRIAGKGYIFDEENVDVTEKTIKNIATTTKVEKLTTAEPKTYTELTDAEYDLYFDKISDINGVLNFSPDAINNEFRITISSKYFDENYGDQDDFKFTHVVKVVSGYNVYDVKGLSLLDNSNKDNNEHYGWDKIKTQEEIALSNNINSLILHNDIQIKDSDIPSNLFWSQAEVNDMTPAQREQTNLPIVGSLKDRASLAVFNRKVSGDFKVYGNYYTIDSSLISKCVLDNSWDCTDPDCVTPHGVKHDANVPLDDNNTKPEGEVAITIHSNLIFMEPMNNASAFKNVDFTNVSFLGNGARSNRSIYSGGHILFKSQGVKLTMNNCVHKDYFIGYFVNKYDGVQHSEEDLSSFRFENCNGSNSFNTLFYVYGARDVKIVNSIFSSAGGPGMIIDHVDGDEDRADGKPLVDPDIPGKLNYKGFPSFVEIINSTVESYVTGNEPWFTTYPVAKGLFTGLTPANALFTNANLFTQTAGLNKTATFMQTYGEIPNAINVVAVMKVNDVEDAVGGEIYGGVVIKSSESDTSAHGLNMQGKDGGLSQKAMATLQGDGSGIPYFESHKTGSYVNVGLDEKTQQPIDGLFDINLDVNGDKTYESFADGDYVNVYLHIGMGAVFGLQDTTPAQQD